jgi:hypothetical protein
LDFNLGLGTADFDLAQLAVSTLKIKSASADIFIHYSTNLPNLVAMDTLLVTLNMGAVDLHQAQLTQAKKVIIEVNYGQISLNYGQPQSYKGQVIAAVAGGTIYLKLPPESSPVKIRMKTTPLCRIAVPDYLRAIGEDTFVTKGYSASDPRLLEFVLDVDLRRRIIGFGPMRLIPNCLYDWGQGVILVVFTGLKHQLFIVDQ